jgi:hypothetical protein
MENVFNDFIILLKKRFELGIFTTEDSIRYTFFYALISKGSVLPHEIILEYPHPAIQRAEIDTYIPSFQGTSLAIEFKYDREIPSGQAIPKPQNAGELFKDMDRLARFNSNSDLKRIQVYVADRLMVTYFNNPENGHKDFFSLRQGLKIEESYLAGKPKTFVNSLKARPSFEILCLLSEKLPGEHELRIFQVMPI